MNVLRVRAGFIKNKQYIDDIMLNFTQEEVDAKSHESFIECLQLAGKKFDYILSEELDPKKMDIDNKITYYDSNDFDLTLKH